MAKNTNTDTAFDISQFGDFDIGFENMNLTEASLPSLHHTRVAEAQVQCTKVELVPTGDQAMYPSAPRANFFFNILSEQDVWPIKSGFNIPHKLMTEKQLSTSGRQLRDFCAGLGVKVESVLDFLEALNSDMFVGIIKWARITYTPAEGKWNEKNGIGGFLQDK